MVVDSFTAKDELMRAITTARNNPAIVLSRVKVGKNVYSRHYSDQELQADSCAARLLARVYPQHEDLAGILGAFLRDLTPSTADSHTPAGASRNGAAVAGTAGADRVLTEAQDIVTTPAERHPTTQERIRNLRTMYAELTGASRSSSQR
jgi:Zn-dependent protease with chaperone function